MNAATEQSTERALSFAKLPDRLDGWRVLEVGGDSGGRSYLGGIGASEFVTLEEPSEEADLKVGTFDLVVCSSGLVTDLHPLAVYAWLRRAVKDDGTLVAGSAVLADSTRSQYARLLPSVEEGTGPQWLPGRLAFRWMVEVSGFDVVRWLGEDGEDESRAYLQARAADRIPALDLDRQPLGR